VRIGDGSLYDWFVEEIAAAQDPEQMVEELDAAMALLKQVRERRRFAGLAATAFDAVAREQVGKRPRKRRVSR
jgi:hypothetical protein